MDDDTLQKLKAAFAGESQANRKYLAFAEKAEKDGFPNVAILFRAVAAAETIHAHNHFRLFGLGSTADNVKAAVQGENHEVTEMYPEYIDIAENAGEGRASKTFVYALEAEKIHERMFINALEKVLENQDMEIDENKISVCGMCGYTTFGSPPDECPVCKAKKEIFKIIE
ncbi:rubrerythrin family protein [Candidatus Bathyarchaeota archaeon]|nr:rubrerythrin family protein [Candidatus Bathyarchaeota archaeon]